MKPIFAFACIVLLSCAECGTSGRYNTGGMGSEGGWNSGARNSRGNYMTGGKNPPQYLQQMNGNKNAEPEMPPPLRSESISTTGIISIITFVIVLGFIGYWGVICYPLFFRQDRQDYLMMHASSTHTTTPTISGEFEKLGNYSSRSTTPSRSNE